MKDRNQPHRQKKKGGIIKAKSYLFERTDYMQTSSKNDQ